MSTSNIAIRTFGGLTCLASELTLRQNLFLEETVDETWEPTFEEIQEYAAFLGMNHEADKEFYYIAKQGLKDPLPPPWKPCKTAVGEVFYFNSSTGESAWDHPYDEFYRKQFQDAKASRELKKRDSQSMHGG